MNNISFTQKTCGSELARDGHLSGNAIFKTVINLD